MYIYLFTTLLLAHLIADFPLQTDLIFRLKNKNWMGVALHASVHVVVTGLLLPNSFSAWPLLAALGFLHFLCDWTKLRCQSNSQASIFLLDQTAHVIVLLLLAGLFVGIQPILPFWLICIVVGWAFIPAVAMFHWVAQMEMGTKKMDRPTYIRWMRHEGEWGAHWIGVVAASCVTVAFHIAAVSIALRRPRTSIGA